MKKLNNKGYMLIEIILASVITFTIAFSLINLIIDFKNKNEDLYNDTAILSDKIAITKNIMNDLEKCKVVHIPTPETKEDGTKIVNFTVLEPNQTETKNKRLEINKDLIIYGDYDTVNNKYITNNKSYYKKKILNSTDVGEPQIISEEGGTTIRVTVPITSVYTEKKHDINLFINSFPHHRVTYEGTGGTVQAIDNLISRYDGFLNKANSHDSGSTNWVDQNSKNNGTVVNGTWGEDYLEFNGTNSCVKLGIINSSYQTIEAVFSLNQVKTISNQEIIGNWEDGGGGIFIDSKGYISGQYYINSSYQTIVSKVKTQINEKYHVALTYDGSKIIIYVNGVESNTVNVAGTILPPQNSTIMVLGANPAKNTCGADNSVLDGKIYSAAIYNKALTAAQIAADYGQIVIHGQKYESLSTPQRAGYTFNGWYKETGFNTQITNDTIVTIPTNHTLYSKWTINPYTLTINPSGGTYAGETEVEQNYNTVYTMTNDLSKAGYIFNGWTHSGKGKLDYYYESASGTAAQTNTYNYTASNSTLPTVYNNNSNGTVTASMVQYAAATGGYALKIVTNGEAKPGAGGIYFSGYPTTPGLIHVIKVKANIPTGYTLKLGGVGPNYTGIGSTYKTNDAAGISTWKTYYLTLYTGITGIFNSNVFLYIEGTNNTNVTWYINQITITSYTKDNFKSKYTFGDGEAETLTANWVAGGSKVTFNANGGTFNTTYVKNWNNGYYNVKAASGSNSATADRMISYNAKLGEHPGATQYNWIPDTRVISKSGSTLQGWYTTATGGTKIFNANGTLIRSLTGYSDSESKWIKYDANVTLYARWS